MMLYIAAVQHCTTVAAAAVPGVRSRRLAGRRAAEAVIGHDMAKLFNQMM
jgi:HD superfamily phosphohydrolase YqeK